MPSRFIDQFDVILLDMARTFMFNVDRFSAEEDFTATYRQIGGTTLSDDMVQQIITDLVSTIEPDYQDPRSVEYFSDVSSYLKVLPSSRSLPRHELDLLEQVFALHEVGEIPAPYADALQQLRHTHRLGVVSDIWSKKDLFLQEFERVNVGSLFDVIVFSSDHGCVKPSSRLFRKALAAFTVDRSRVVFVGDSWMRDIVGAKMEKLATIWINATGAAAPKSRFQPDLVVQALQVLL
ncbi:MAG: HAD family hydrolase [Candidatus Binatia bacterium]